MAIQVNPLWLISIPQGVLKIAQILLAIIVLICMSAANYSLGGAGWVQFVATLSLVVCIVFAVLHVLNVPDTIEHFPWHVCQMAVGGFFVLCYFISLIVASVLASRAGSIVPLSNTHGCYTAAAIFTVGAIGVWAAEGYLEMQKWRQSKYRQTETVENEAPPGGLA